MSNFSVHHGSLTFPLQVRPRASRDRLRMAADGTLRLEIHASPQGGEANEACRRFLARCLGAPVAAVEITAGAKSRRKLIRVATQDPEAALRQLCELASTGRRSESRP